jgi:hypothetical protein
MRISKLIEVELENCDKNLAVVKTYGKILDDEIDAKLREGLKDEIVKQLQNVNIHVAKLLSVFGTNLWRQL